MNDNAYKLLKGNLETMYSQTKEWIEDIEFYEEELDFFNSLISDRINSTTAKDLNHKDIYRNIDTLLYKLSEDLITQIKAHRKELAGLINANNIEENHEENKKHFHLLEKMAIVKHGIKKLKKALFKYLKDNPFDYDFETLFKEL